MTSIHHISDDSSQPEAVLRAFFKAGEDGDVAAVRDCVTDDFTLYEAGHIENYDFMVRAVTAIGTSGGIYRWYLSDLKTRIDGNLATIVYRNRGEHQPAGAADIQRPAWLESAILTFTDRWRLSFLHSTPIAPSGK